MSDLIDVEKYLDFMERETRDVFRRKDQHAPNPTWAVATQSDLDRLRRFCEVELQDDIPMGVSRDHSDLRKRNTDELQIRLRLWR